MRKIKSIQTIVDPKGNEHTILVYGKKEIYWGNKKFDSMAEVKDYINKKMGEN